MIRKTGKGSKGQRGAASTDQASRVRVSEQTRNRRGKPFEPGNKVGKRFKPGRSGNPGGRPKGRLTAQLHEWLDSTNPETGKTYAEEFIEKFGKRAIEGSDRLAVEMFNRSDGPVQSEEEARGNENFHITLSFGTRKLGPESGQSVLVDASPATEDRNSK